MTRGRKVGYVAGLVLVLLVAGATAQETVAGEQRRAQVAHLVFTSPRDGDDDVYAVDQEGRRAAALTRNRVPDGVAFPFAVGIPAGAGWLAVERGREVVLVSGDGRRERRLGPAFRPVFSPNGGMLAFARENEATEVISLLVTAVSGGRARVLGQGAPLEFSPDGGRLAFSTESGGIGIADVAGGRRWAVRGSIADDFPELVGWSPNGARIAFLRRDESNISNPITTLLVVNARRPSAKPVAVARGESLAARWLTNTRLGFERRTGRTPPEIGTVAPTGGHPRILVRGDVYLSAWSPRGDRVAYVRRLSDDENELVLAPTDGREGQPVARASNFNVVWSTSGRRLAIRAEPPNENVDRILVAGAGGRSVVTVTQGELILLHDWAPDERRIAVSVEYGLAVVDVGRRRLRRVWTGPMGSTSRWIAGPLARAAPTAAPAPPSETASPRQLRTRGPIYELAADGNNAAALVGTAPADCGHRLAWRAGTRAIVRFSHPEPCGNPGYDHALELAGTQLTWQNYHCGNYCYLAACSADLRRANRESCAEETEVPDVRPPRPQPPTETRRDVTMTASNGVLRLLRATDGRARTIRPGGRVVDAALEDVGLYYAFNLRRRLRGQVVFVPFGELFP